MITCLFHHWVTTMRRSFSIEMVWDILRMMEIWHSIEKKKKEWDNFDQICSLVEHLVNEYTKNKSINWIELFIEIYHQISIHRTFSFKKVMPSSILFEEYFLSFFRICSNEKKKREREKCLLRSICVYICIVDVCIKCLMRWYVAKARRWDDGHQWRKKKKCSDKVNLVELCRWWAHLDFVYRNVTRNDILH